MALPEEFTTALIDHWGHQTFRGCRKARQKTWGFQCNCSSPTEWLLPESQAYELDPEDSYLVQEPLGDVLQGIKKAAKRRERREASQVRSKALLYEHLTPKQIKDLQRTGAFTMEGADGCTYRISKQSQHNVQRLEDWELVETFCLVFKDFQIPVYDLMLAQKLLLESDPELFKKLANRIGGRPPRRWGNPELDRIFQMIESFSGTRARHWR